MIDINGIVKDDFPAEIQIIVDKIGIAETIDILREFQGCQIYMPKLETVAIRQVRRQMYDDFLELGNYKRIAVKYNLSESRTRQVIRDEKKRRFKSKVT